MFKALIVATAWCLFLAAPQARTAEAAAPAPETQRQTEEKAAEEKLNELDRNMQELKTDRKNGSQPREEINRLYEEFKQRQGSARGDLENLRSSTNDAWHKAKKRMDKAIDDLNGLYERTKEKYEGKADGDRN